jgi:hypothetical protein
MLIQYALSGKRLIGMCPGSGQEKWQRSFGEHMESVFPFKDIRVGGFSICNGHCRITIFVDLVSDFILHAVEEKAGQDMAPFLRVF